MPDAAVAQRDEENPLVEGLERLPVPGTSLVIFGATGDLARRKLLPALYNLAHEGALPERFNLIGVSRSEMSDDEYRKVARDSIQEHSRRAPDEQVARERQAFASGEGPHRPAHRDVSRRIDVERIAPLHRVTVRPGNAETDSRRPRAGRAEDLRLDRRAARIPGRPAGVSGGHASRLAAGRALVLRPVSGGHRFAANVLVRMSGLMWKLSATKTMSSTER